MKIMDDFHYDWKPPQNRPVVSKDEWDKKEDTGKFMKNALHAQWYGN